MDMTAYVTVTNNSGEQYEDATIRLVVGVIHMVERIIDLAGPPGSRLITPDDDMENMAKEMDEDFDRDAAKGEGRGMSRPKSIDKAGLSEYYIYTVEGTETIPHAWQKRLKSFTTKDIPLKTVYRYEPAKFGPEFTKVLEFKNDEEHKLGKEPLPDGIVRLYKSSGTNMGWMGALASKYIAKGDEVKVNVGPDPEVTMKTKRMSFKKQSLSFRNNRLEGWDTVEEFTIDVRTFRNRAIEIEIHRDQDGDFDFESEDKFEKHDARTRKIAFALKAGESRKLTFKVSTRFGTNVRNK